MKMIYYKEESLNENKAYCIQFQPEYTLDSDFELFNFSFPRKYNNHWLFNFNLFGIVSLRFSITKEQDHAGVELNIKLWPLFLHMSYYDKRHWNDDKNRFYNYEETDEEGNPT